MRDASPSPIASTLARRALSASTSRNSRPTVSGGETSFHVLPASVVRSTSPSLPPTQAVRLSTASSPRYCWSEPVGTGTQRGFWWAAAAAGSASTITAMNPTTPRIRPRTLARRGAATASGRREGVDLGELGRNRPQAGGDVGVDRVGVDSRLLGRRCVRVGRLGDVAVLAVDAAHADQLRRGGRPGRRRGALLGRLELEPRRAVLGDPAVADHLLAREVTLERGHDP